MKIWWKSKTMLFSFVTSLAGVLAIAVPALSNVQPFMTKNEAYMSIAWGLMAGILRTVTKDKIVLTD